jgi:hypothetical protein
VVRGFADHLNGVINRTASECRLSVIADKSTDRPRFDIARLVEGAITPLDLNGSRARLLVQQKVEVEDDHVSTLTYVYRYQLDETKGSWLFRWEFFRNKPKDDYPYPLAHFHVNANMETRADLDHVHFPTRRVPLELVLWDLIEEWSVKPLDDDWRAILEESIGGFDERQRVR